MGLLVDTSRLHVPPANSPRGRFPAAVLTVRGARAPLNPPPPTPGTPPVFVRRSTR